MVHKEAKVCNKGFGLDKFSCLDDFLDSSVSEESYLLKACIIE